MCGIAGILGRDDERAVRIMTQMQRHRGPDGGAVWTGRHAALGHRRLNIIDLSAQARQPMLSEDGRFALTFNGEIFNFRELREELRSKGHDFRTRSDSEVLLRACMEWDERALPRLRGQFAFAFHDNESGRTLLARDHLGVKPLYLAEEDGALYFASEAKAIAAVLPRTREVAMEHIPAQLAFLWVPGERTLFRGIRRLPPGHALRWEHGAAKQWCYWDLIEQWKRARSADARPEQRDEELRVRLGEALQSQLVSDVPLGVLLSGGLDSTILLALLREHGVMPDCLTAAYSDSSRARDVFEDDMPYARMAAERFGASLREIDIAPGPESVIRRLPEVLWHLDEPLADPTVIANDALTQTAKATHTVLLTGMGADEVFAGYPRYPAVMLGEGLRQVPTSVFRIAGAAVRTMLRFGMLGIEQARRPLQLLEHVHKPFEQRFLGYSSYLTVEQLRQMLAPEAVGVIDEEGVFGHHHAVLHRTRGLSPLSRMLAADALTFLPQLNLENMDKTSMAHGVEMRVPFLDHTLLEFCMTLPDADKLAAGDHRKVGLRRAFDGRIPENILHRPKTGYSPPVRGWLRGGLQEFVRDTLLASDARSAALFQRDVLRAMLDDNEAGKRDAALPIWAALTLELWLRNLVDEERWRPAGSPDDLPLVTAPGHAGAAE